MSVSGFLRYSCNVALSCTSNTDVQWLRARFNECFDKAEYAKGRLVGDIPDSAMLAEKLIFDRALEMVSLLASQMLTVLATDEV